MFGKFQNIHLVGIGGSGMNGIAEVLLNRGFRVSGSDLHSSKVTERLRKLGAEVRIGHASDNVDGAQVVVISTAVKDDNPEVQRAKELGIPVIPRAEMLMELMRMKYGIAVGGAHGKTTTTSLVLSVLTAAGRDPTAVIGGRVNALGSNAKLGQGEMFIVEADESDGSFLRLIPTIAVITNIDREHMDHYKSMDAVRRAFVEFANRVPFYGAAVVCLDDAEVQEIVPHLKRRVVTYGLSTQADVRGRVISREGRGCHFEVEAHGEKKGAIKLQIPGLHNVRNALAAVAVGLECGAKFADLKKGLEEFNGIERRFQIKGEAQDVMVYDDYGHHPREIEATLAACREVHPKRRLIVAFQPHRYTRLADLFDEFVLCFEEADELFVLPVYAAGEAPIAGVDSEKLAKAIRARGKQPAEFVADRAVALNRLTTLLKKGDVLLTLGAGDVWKLAEETVEALKSQSSPRK